MVKHKRKGATLHRLIWRGKTRSLLSWTRLAYFLLVKGGVPCIRPTFKAQALMEAQVRKLTGSSLHVQLNQHGRHLLQSDDSSEHLIHIHGEPSIQHCTAVPGLECCQLPACHAMGGSKRPPGAPLSLLPAGWLMAASWGFLIPIGVTLAIFRSLRGMRPWWFYLHSVIQTLGFLLSLAGIGVGAQLNIDEQLQTRHRQAPGPSC